MALDPLTAILEIGGKVLDKIFPDKTQADAAKFKLLEMANNKELEGLKSEFQLLVGQQEINKEEAKHGSLFIAGWRPFIGWVCGASFAWNFVGSPVAYWVAALAGKVMTPLNLSLSELMPVLLGMLGLAGYRTYEKVKGVERSQ